MKLKALVLSALLLSIGVFAESNARVVRWVEAGFGQVVELFVHPAETSAEAPQELDDVGLLAQARAHLAEHRAKLPEMQERLGTLKSKTLKALREERALEHEVDVFERDLQGGRLLLTSSNGSVLRFGDRSFERTRVEEDVKRREARLASLGELLASKRGLRAQLEDSHAKLLAHVESWRTRLQTIENRIELGEVRLRDAREKAELRDLLRTDLAFLTGNPLAMALEEIEQRVEAVVHGAELGDESFLDYGAIADSFGAHSNDTDLPGTKTSTRY